MCMFCWQKPNLFLSHILVKTREMGRIRIFMNLIWHVFLPQVLNTYLPGKNAVLARQSRRFLNISEVEIELFWSIAVLAFCFLFNLVILAVNTDIKGQLHSQMHFKLIKYLKTNKGTFFIQCFSFRCLFFSNMFMVWGFCLVVMLSGCHSHVGFSWFCF